MNKFNERKNTEFNKEQRWVEINKVFSISENKASGYMVELQYIFKSKKKALMFFDKIDKELSNEFKKITSTRKCNQMEEIICSNCENGQHFDCIIEEHDVRCECDCTEEQKKINDNLPNSTF